MHQFIELPHGGVGAGFYVSELINYIRHSGRDYIIQGQQNCTLEDHTKPHSLDVWLRKNCTRRRDTKQAVNRVVDALLATGRFELEQDLICPDSGRRCKGLRLLDRPDSRSPPGGSAKLSGRRSTFARPSLRARQAEKPSETLALKDYRAIFDAIESTLIRVGSRNLPESQIRANLDQFKKVEDKQFSDADYHWVLVSVIFYSGFRAATVTDKLDLIRRYFPDYATVADYGDDDVRRILQDPEMIRNGRKIQFCIENARSFARIVSQHGSFASYVASFSPVESFESLMLLKEELQYRFSGLGEVTTYHVLTDIGLPVLKPDRVICRIFSRLGLVENEKQRLKTVIQGRRFARATGHPIRYVDIVFVAFGQLQAKEFGLERGICLKDNPTCAVCGARRFCGFFARDGRVY